MFNKNKEINKITITLSSPEYILNESFGEILNSETINYRTKKPVKDGLFCEKIFGPIKDYECTCGKYKNIRYKGIFCDKCGIEITKKSVRRKRIGHIKLCVPIVHIWAFRCLPNKISCLINKSSKKVENIIYYDKYIILQIGEIENKKINGKKFKKYDLINEEEYLKIKKFNNKKKYKNKKKFIAKTGGEAIYEILKNININKLYLNLKKKYYKEKSIQKKKVILKKLYIIELFKKGQKKNKLIYMLIKILPVIPPDLRPLVLLDGGKYASSDLNDFYRKIIIRNNRLKKLINIKAPNVILKNEKRMLQESVDSLLDNSRKILSVKSDSNRILKSLSDILKGKQGRFRQNLLGKRVDYSARSVIVVDPKLKLHECGLPKEIALELYKPFIINKLINRGIVKTIKDSKIIIKKKKKIVLNILKNLIKGHPILLNRAPTLHRLSIQAFYPILINGKSIKLHPLVCTAFNADFDGDQMAIHLPLSIESILETQLLMLSNQNILNISNGNPIIIPTQDIILGLYYLTKKKKKKKLKIFSSFNEVILALKLNKISLHKEIYFYFLNKKIRTTVGRVLFNNIIPNKKKIGFINKNINNKSIKNIISKILYNTDILTTSKFLDSLKELGFYYCFKGGLSFNIKDIITPRYKKIILNKTIKKKKKILKYYNMGLITNNEKYNKIIDEWSKTTSKITKIVIKKIKKKKKGFNSIYMILDSGARSSKEQIRQLSGMRGLMAKPQKSKITNLKTEIIENPIISNFLEGLSTLEYFISTHGSRKGLADTALKTADAGYLTRRLVDSVQDIIIKERDCKTLNGIKIIINNKNYNILYNEILGRIILFDVFLKDLIFIKKNKIIDEKLIKKIKKYKIPYIIIRSPLTCETINGICTKCYGTNLSNGNIIRIGEAVGVIAAQSIGEPGTQLTLRTFHVGGSASNISEDTEFISKYKGKIFFLYLKYIKKKKKYIVISRFTEIKILDIKKKKIIYNNNIPYGSILYYKNNDIINIGDKIYEWDPYNSILISEYNGIIKYNNIKKNITYKVYIDENTGLNEKIIIENKNIIPSLIILNKKGNILKNYNLPIGAYLKVKNKEKIKKGKILIKIPRKYSKSKDITGGLPRLSELFEARSSSNKAVLSDIDGIVSYGKNKKKGNIKIIITSTNNKKIKRKYIIKTSQQILVQNNDYIKYGSKISDGIITLKDILYIKGIRKIQKYLIKKIQEVYKSQGVQINNKHFEIIISKMIKKVKILDSGNTKFIKGNIVNKEDFFKENKKINNMVIIINNNKKKIIKKKILKIKNDFLKMMKKKKIKSIKTLPAIAKPILQGITKSALNNKSFISSASFQETTKILSEAAISAKTDYLEGLKENVIIGKKIPVGTGFKEYNKIKVKYKKK